PLSQCPRFKCTKLTALQQNHYGHDSLSISLSLSLSLPLSLSPCVGVYHVEGMAVDWLGNNVYWTSFGHRKSISVMCVERGMESRRTLLDGGMFHPRAIAVDPIGG
ncbi:low-density lipoprotein receptor-related protein 1B-like, partial [Tachysurus ichikawai]